MALAVPPTRADEQEPSWTSLSLHFTVLMRALTYDHTLRDRGSERLRLGILYDPRQARSAAAADALFKLVGATPSRVTFLKRTIELVRVPVSPDEERLVEALRGGLDVLYVTTGLARAAVLSATEMTRRFKVVSVTGEESFVYLGISLGVYIQEGKAHILIHHRASLEEGASFSSQLLQLAEVVGRKAQAGAR